MQAPHEDKFAAVVRIVRPDPGPSRQDIGKARDVGLAIAAANPERVQLECFTRQIFVEAFVAIDTGDRIRAHRLHIVEIEQHRGVAFDRLQKVGEPAEHVRPNGLAFIGTDHCRIFVGGDAEMV